MAPTLYLFYHSPGVRAVLMTAKAIGLTLEEKEVDILGGELLTPEFLKINPQHTVPTLVEDNGFILWDSHAIMTYLVSKYAKDDNLYPKNLEKRAVVDQRLHFESGIVFVRLARITKAIVLEGKTSVSEEDRNGVFEAYDFFEKMLEGKNFAAGDFITVADYSLVSSIGSLAGFIPLDPERFPNVTTWLKKVQDLPEYDVKKSGHSGVDNQLKKRLTAYFTSSNK